MPNPEFIEEVCISLNEVKPILKKIEKRDIELNFRTNKAREFMEAFDFLTPAKAKELAEKLEGLNLTRLKYDHIAKIVDFLPKSVDDLKTVLMAYPLSLPKKDQEAILGVVKNFI